jgi:hypothetical protein
MQVAFGMKWKAGKSLHEEFSSNLSDSIPQGPPSSFEVPPNIEAKRTLHIPINFSSFI